MNIIKVILQRSAVMPFLTFSQKAWRGPGLWGEENPRAWLWGTGTRQVTCSKCYQQTLHPPRLKSYTRFGPFSILSLPSLMWVRHCHLGLSTCYLTLKASEYVDPYPHSLPLDMATRKQTNFNSISMSTVNFTVFKLDVPSLWWYKWECLPWDSYLVP